MGFIPAQGMRYQRFLDLIHGRYVFDWYMEIGCRDGRTFAPSRSKTIAVDPFFRTETNIIGAKSALHVFQTTSDDFFASGFLSRNRIRLAFSFLDGMHYFEYLLRDFMNAEQNSAAKGIIAMHDCCPFDHEMTTRDLDNLPRRAWAGDVWKLIPILQEYRPDLKIDVFDCTPTGLVLVSGLSPRSKVLREHYDEIVARYMDMTLADFGEDRFFGSFTYRDARKEARAGHPLFAGAASPEALALQPEFVTP